MSLSHKGSKHHVRGKKGEPQKPTKKHKTHLLANIYANEQDMFSLYCIQLYFLIPRNCGWWLAALKGGWETFKLSP